MRALLAGLLMGWLASVPIASAQEKPTVIEVGLLIDGGGGEPVKDAPAPNAKVIESCLEEILPRQPGAPRDATAYFDASLF